MECLLEVSLCLRREFVLYIPKLASALYVASIVKEFNSLSLLFVRQGHKWPKNISYFGMNQNDTLTNEPAN
jgi:hypothetical protein